MNTGFAKLQGLRGDGTILHQTLGCDGNAGELTDGQDWPDERQRGYDGVDTRAIGKAGVHKRLPDGIPDRVQALEETVAVAQLDLHGLEAGLKEGERVVLGAGLAGSKWKSEKGGRHGPTLFRSRGKGKR